MAIQECSILYLSEDKVGAYTGDDTLNGHIEVLPVDLLAGLASGDQCGLVAHVGDVGAGEAGRERGELLGELLLREGARDRGRLERPEVHLVDGGAAIQQAQLLYE